MITTAFLVHINNLCRRWSDFVSMIHNQTGCGSTVVKKRPFPRERWLEELRETLELLEEGYFDE